jgi:hypothetical protein
VPASKIVDKKKKKKKKKDKKYKNNPETWRQRNIKNNKTLYIYICIIQKNNNSQMLCPILAIIVLIFSVKDSPRPLI